MAADATGANTPQDVGAPAYAPLRRILLRRAPLRRLA